MSNWDSYKGYQYYQVNCPVAVSALVFDNSGADSNVISFNVALIQNQKKAIKEQIFSYRNIPENWDGNDAVPPSEKLIDQAMALIDYADAVALSPLLFVQNQPTSHGTLEFELDYNNSKITLELGNSSYLICSENAEGKLRFKEFKLGAEENFKFHDILKSSELISG